MRDARQTAASSAARPAVNHGPHGGEKKNSPKATSRKIAPIWDMCRTFQFLIYLENLSRDSGTFDSPFLEHSYVRNLLYIDQSVYKIRPTEMSPSATPDFRNVVEPNQSISSTRPTIIHSTCSDDGYQPVNEISEEVRSMILRWEKKATADCSQDNCSAYVRSKHISMQVYGPDHLQPPQRYRRVSKRAHLG